MAVGRGGAPAVSADAAGDGVTGQVKLVIWDLDDTLWAGTLSEGPVQLADDRAALVRALNRRGIPSAICSNNEADRARARLAEAGLLDEFVFARIDWTPKGPRVAKIIEDAQLRPENVLFIDDLATNRREVRHFVPAIQTAGPEIAEHLLDLPELAGKDDQGLSRLRQYQILERKLDARQHSSGSNESFLRSCDIRVGIFRDVEEEAERLFELVTRTHQLNFTKRRPEREEFMAMLTDPRVDTGYVRVRDRYGDYGICGFFSLDPEEGALTDFLFSCRALHMGVEQFVYRHLGRPALTVVGEVAASLEGPSDWVTFDTSGFGETGDDPGGAPTVGGGPARRVLMVGGCDLTTTAEYLGGDITTHFSHTGASGSHIHVGHTELLRQSAAGLDSEALAVVDRIPFVDRLAYESPAVVAPAYDLLVYSVLNDYTQGLYRHRRTGLIVPWYQCHHDVTREELWPWVVRRFEREGVDRAFLAWFADEFEALGGVSPERFTDNVRWLAGRVPRHSTIIFLNGAEIPLEDDPPGRHLRHQVMNEALDSTVSTLANASICDVRTLVLGPDDLTENLRHYRRQVYLRMAEEIRAAGGSDHGLERRHPAVRAVGSVYRFAGRRRVQLRRLRKRLRKPT